MNPARAGESSLAIFAILFLLGFGFVVYAVPGASGLSSLDGGSTTTTSGTQGNVVYYHLVRVPTTVKGTLGANASGYAGISISGQSLTLAWSVTAATPDEQLQLAMQVTTSTGATKSLTFEAVQVSKEGAAGSKASTGLDPGTYLIGFIVVDPSTNSRTTIFISDPASAKIVIAASQPAPTTTAIGNTLSYSLVPLPVYLHRDVPSNYSFKEGGALVVVSGYRLQITTSFLGAPNTAFYTVVQTARQNFTAGAATTTSTGGGVFKGNVTLSAGTYQVGLLVYVSGNTASPVAVSVPRAIQVTLPAAGQTSSTTSVSSSATATTTRSSSSSPSSSSTSIRATSTTTASVSNTSSQPSQDVNRLEFAPLTTSVPPKGYLFGQGSGGYAVKEGSIYFSLAFTGQNPGTHYSLVLSVNGTTKTIGDYTTNAKGGGNVAASTTLGTGRFVLGLTLFDASSFNVPTAVMASVPSGFIVNAHATSSTTSTTRTTTSSSTSTETPKGPHWEFKLVPAIVSNVPTGYRFASSGTAVVTLHGQYSLLNVVLGFQDANPSTTYNAALVLNGTSVNLGSMTTNKAGVAELHASVQVSPGRYLLGVMVYDVSDISAFNANGPVLVMVSNPNTQLAVIVPNTRDESSTTSRTSSASQGSTSSQSVTTSTVTTTVTTISAGSGSEVETQIRDAVDSLTIPATVQITPLLSSTTVRDSRFSLSVGQQVGNGLVIAISGENVTGPRVLLINMSRTSPLALYPSLNITLDGVPVFEAASALQVLNPSSSDPPRYVVVATSTSIQLLVSIPHFSLHLIQVAGQVVHDIQTSLALNAPLLAGSILVVTLAFAGAYAARKRFFSILP